MQKISPGTDEKIVVSGKLTNLSNKIKTLNHETPLELGYRMPAEWEPHSGTWLTWPRPEGISYSGQI